jgi:hypothetical protein
MFGACHADPAPVLVRYRNREIRAEDLDFIRATIAGGPKLTRTEIATAICDAWNWRQCDGRYKIKACHDLLLRLEEWGHITLHPRTTGGTGSGRNQWPRLPKELVPLAWWEANQADVDLRRVVVRPIAEEERAGWRLFVERFHYLGCQPIIGESLLYVAEYPDLASEVLALIGWASASFRAPLREDYIGWDESTKRQRQHLVVNNVRFLVPGWVQVQNLASRVLSQNLRRLSADWQQRWGHPVYLAESFVDTSRYQGTCYRASNWICLGHTAGRTKRGNRYLKGGSPKAHYVFPLRRDFRRLLVSGRTR